MSRRKEDIEDPSQLTEEELKEFNIWAERFAEVIFNAWILEINDKNKNKD